MRKFDKIVKIQKANILAEQRYVKLKEGFEDVSLEPSVPEFNNTTELLDFLVNKALGVNNKYIDWDVKREISDFKFLGTYRVETPELNYTLVISDTYVNDRDPNYGGFQGETIWITNFDNIGNSWVKYEQFLDQIDEHEIDKEILNQETQDKLEHHINEFQTDWWNDEFNY
jgi:hypothetical protein